MRFVSSPCKGENWFGIQKQSNVTSDTKSWLKLVSCVSCDWDLMLIFFKIKNLNRPQLVINQNHFRYLLSFLFPLVIFNVRMLENMSIINHDVKALINNFPVLRLVDEISHLVSWQRIRVPVLNYSGRFFTWNVRT